MTDKFEHILNTNAKQDNDSCYPKAPPENYS